MPYKILDNSLQHKGTKEDLWNDLEAQGWDLIELTERFAIFHKPAEKIKTPRKIKEPKIGPGASTSGATIEKQSGESRESTLHLPSGK